jgi:3-methyladenine DNA glycosylase AlkC
MSAMDATTIKAMLEQHFEYAHNDPEHAHAMSTEGATLELPQSGELFAGVENMWEWRSNYPANTSFESGRSEVR